jgi:hypothetical protein
MPGQLGLFQGPRQRGRKPPPPSELALHCLIVDTLKRWIMPGWFYAHVPNGEQRSQPAAIKLLRMGVRAGVSDLILFGPPTASLHALEIKRKGSYPTRTQIEFIHIVRAAGGKADWIDSYEEALAVLQDWGALPTTIQTVGGGVIVRRALPLPEGDDA